MCVILYTEKGNKISEQEINNAWNINQHGGGFAIRLQDKIYFERGFMTLKEFKEAIKPYNGKYDLMLHFRISTSDKINRVQTHPYNVENVLQMKGYANIVASMNGIIFGQEEYLDMNDTMSYIIDNNFLFKRINRGKYWGDKISSHSGAKWCIMTPETNYISDDFIEGDNINRSNENHIFYENFRGDYDYKDKLNKKMVKMIRKNKKIVDTVNKYIEEKCNSYDCANCYKCIKNCNTLKNLKTTIKENQ